MSGVSKSRVASAVFLDVLNGIDDLVHKLEGHTGNDTFGISEGALESTEGDTGFLCRDAGEELHGKGGKGRPRQQAIR